LRVVFVFLSWCDMLLICRMSGGIFVVRGWLGLAAQKFFGKRRCGKGENKPGTTGPAKAQHRWSRRATAAGSRRRKNRDRKKGQKEKEKRSRPRTNRKKVKSARKKGARDGISAKRSRSSSGGWGGDPKKVRRRGAGSGQATN